MAVSQQPKDMRTWIAELEAAGELIRIDKPVDPLTQMGSLLYQSREKALFFEKLPHGWRSLGPGAGERAPRRARVRHHRGNGDTARGREAWAQLIPPVMVADGPGQGA